MQKCLGGPGCPDCCQPAYTGDFCAECAPNHYRDRYRCVPCVDGQQAMMQLYLASFVFIFNLCLFVLHYDVMNVLFDTICTLQTYRAIGLMGSTMLPEAVLMLYSKLGLIALDYEFGQPGCEGTQSDFVSIYRMNLMLLVVSASPVFVIMPLLAQLGALVEK